MTKIVIKQNKKIKAIESAINKKDYSQELKQACIRDKKVYATNRYVLAEYQLNDDDIISYDNADNKDMYISIESLEAAKLSKFQTIIETEIIDNTELKVIENVTINSSNITNQHDVYTFPSNEVIERIKDSTEDNAIKLSITANTLRIISEIVKKSGSSTVDIYINDDGDKKPILAIADDIKMYIMPL